MLARQEKSEEYLKGWDIVSLALIGGIWAIFIALYFWKAGSTTATGYFLAFLMCCQFRIWQLHMGFIGMLCWAAFCGAQDSLQLHWTVALLLGAPIFPLIGTTELFRWIARRHASQALS